MRVTRWMLGTLALTAAIASSVGAGCSSSSDNTNGNPPANEDAGNGNDATTGGDSGGNNGMDAETCSVDASLTAFAASDASGSACAACFNAMCQDAIHTCATDCKCIEVFRCIADAGTVDLNSLFTVGLSCVGGLANATTLLSNPGIGALTNCSANQCRAACAPIADGGSPMSDGSMSDSSTTTTDGGDAGHDGG